MPPLLPEYLSQPVQIVVQSQPTDWWSVGGTILGSAFGAGLGAYFSYTAAKKASQRAYALQKSEDLYELAQGCISDLSHLDHIYFGIPTSISSHEEKHQLLYEASSRFDRFYEQLHIYSEEKGIDREYLLRYFSLWRAHMASKINSITGMKHSFAFSPYAYEAEKPEGYFKARKEYRKTLGSISVELETKIRRIGFK